MAVDDEIWRPGYDGPEPVASTAVIDAAARTHGRSERPLRRRTRGMPVIVGALACGLAVVASIAVSVSVRDVVARGTLAAGQPLAVADAAVGHAQTSDDPVGREESSAPLDDLGRPLAMSDQPRIPDALGQRWTTELAPLGADSGASATTWIEAIGDRYVVVGIGDTRALSGPSAVHVLDAATGRSIWVAQFESRLDRIRFVDVIGQSFVVVVDSDAVAFDVATGNELWSKELTPADGGLQHIERLDGTDLLGLFSLDPDRSVVVLNPATGATVAEMIGEIIGNDLQGRWHVLRGGKVFEFDLGVRGVPAGSAGAQPGAIVGALIATVDASAGQPVAVAGDALVTTTDGELAFGRFETGGERIIGPGGLTPLTTAIGAPGDLVSITGLIPLGGSAFVVVGGGVVRGAEVVDGSIRFVWARSGSVEAVHPNERAVRLVIASDGDSTRTLVDGATGDSVIVLSSTPGPVDTLDVVANGVVLHGLSREGFRVAGLDAVGDELWTLDGSAPVSVGSDTVVRSLPRADGSFEVTAYGGLR